MTLRVNSENVTDTADMYVVEDPAKDQGSIYLCSTQNIELKLQIPKRMKTWEEAYTVTAGSDKKDGQIKSTSKLYEQIYSKVVEMDQEPNKQIQEGEGKTDTNPDENPPNLSVVEEVDPDFKGDAEE